MTERSPIVSIIVPVYGAEAYLPACIESLCRQTYPHIRIILVDDQSPDGCPEICDRYAEQDSRIVVIHQENKGVSGARNTGLEQARGDYVMFVDSDDELYPDAVEILLQDAEKYGADLVSAAMESAKTPREQEAPCTVFRGEESLVQSINGHPGTISACAKLYRSDLIRDIRFEEGKNINEDGFFVFQCCVQKPVFVQHDIVVYLYNVREGSNSRQRFSDKYLAILYYCDRKKAIIASQFPHYTGQACNMEVRANLDILQILCSTTEKKYRALQKQCARTVRRLRAYHRPINRHHRRLEWIVTHGLYPLYKMAIRLKYYR